MSQASSFENSYADFSIGRSLRQVKDAVAGRGEVDYGMRVLLEQVELAENRMEAVYGKPVENCDILEIGPGQGMERALYFGKKNTITGIDTDVIPFGFEPGNYLRMLQKNGFGRFAKTAGRELIIGRKNRKAWTKLIGADRIKQPKRAYGNICEMVPARNAFDVVMSWSVLSMSPSRHAPSTTCWPHCDPAASFTSASTSGQATTVTTTFAPSPATKTNCRCGRTCVARPKTRSTRVPSSTNGDCHNGANCSTRAAPATPKSSNHSSIPAVHGPKITGQLANELGDYTREELLTVNAVYVGRKA